MTDQQTLFRLTHSDEYASHLAGVHTMLGKFIGIDFSYEKGVSAFLPLLRRVARDNGRNNFSLDVRYQVARQLLSEWMRSID